MGVSIIYRFLLENKKTDLKKVLKLKKGENYDCKR